MLVPPFLDYLWNCQEDRGLKNASREEKKKGASANDWLKPVVAGQNQGFQLQATETNSDRFKRRNFSKKLSNNHWEDWKRGSENIRTENSGSYLRPQVQSQPRKSEMRAPLPPLPRAAPLPPSVSSALDTWYHRGQWEPGYFCCPAASPGKDSPMSHFVGANNFWFLPEQEHLIGQVLVVCPCPSCKGD